MSRSPRPRTRAETKLATRAALIAAALEEMARSGLDVSLDDICARAGLTRGAFYVHFADRDALLIAVMEHVLGDFVALLTAAASHAGGVAKLTALFFAAARARAPAVHGGRGLRFHHLMDACRRSKAIGDAYRKTILDARDRIAGAIAQDDHARDDIPAPAMASLMTVTALGLVAMLELDLPLDLGELERTVTKVFRQRA